MSTASATANPPSTPLRLWRPDPLHFDAPLCPSSASRQVADAARRLREVPYELVVTTPLTRALQTTLGLFAGHPASPPLHVACLHREHCASSCDVGRLPAGAPRRVPEPRLRASRGGLVAPGRGAGRARGLHVEPRDVLTGRVGAFRDWLCRPARAAHRGGRPRDVLLSSDRGRLPAIASSPSWSSEGPRPPVRGRAVLALRTRKTHASAPPPSGGRVVPAWCQFHRLTGSRRRSRRAVRARETRETLVAQSGSQEGPLLSGVAARYASALFELAQDAKAGRRRRGRPRPLRPRSSRTAPTCSASSARRSSRPKSRQRRSPPSSTRPGSRASPATSSASSRRSAASSRCRT